MDSNIVGYVDTVFDNLLTYLLTPDNTYVGTQSDKVFTSNYLGMGGAAIAATLSLYGAFELGATTIEEIEEAFFSFLEDY